MSFRIFFGCAVALCTLSHHNSVFAHAIAGDRIFPATLGIDDPGVSDELALPTLANIPHNSDGAHEYDLNFSFAKRITDNFAISVGEGWTHLTHGGSGWQNLDIGLKYQFYVNAPHEFMMSVGVDYEFGKTGAKAIADPFNTVTPSLYFGKGFGDLPTVFNALRPIAVTGQFGFSFPTQRQTGSVSFDDTGLAVLSNQLNPTVFNWGFTVQYSLPYLNANVMEVGGFDFVRHLVPLVEFAFQTPVSNAPAGGWQTTGTIQPGVIYMGQSYQVAIEALVPLNKASGKRIGAIAELHFFLDDSLPNSIGKPIFK